MMHLLFLSAVAVYETAVIQNSNSDRKRLVLFDVYT